MGAATSRVHLPSAVYPPPTDKEAGHGVDLTGIVPGQPGARAHPLPASSSTEGQLKRLSAPATELPPPRWRRDLSIAHIETVFEEWPVTFQTAPRRLVDPPVPVHGECRGRDQPARRQAGKRPPSKGAHRRSLAADCRWPNRTPRSCLVRFSKHGAFYLLGSAGM